MKRLLFGLGFMVDGQKYARSSILFLNKETWVYLGWGFWGEVTLYFQGAVERDKPKLRIIK